MSGKVAIVTGSNKGVGLSIVKSLSAKLNGAVYLTSRDNERGLAAVAKLKDEGFKVEFHQLDVSDRKSVENFRDFIKNKHGGIDILVNNAAVANISDLMTLNYDICKEIVDINFKSLLTIEELLFPLLRDNARVLNISSDCGHLSNVRNKHWLQVFSKEDFTTKDINDFVDWFLNGLKNGTFSRDDISDNSSIVAYRVSKVAMSAQTIIQQKALNSRGISVNSMHPGLVKTDMTGGIGFFSTDDAAKIPVYLVTEAPADLKGQYVWFDGKILDWYDYNAEYYFKITNFNLYTK